ncbi:MAG TPA: hypothetical protein PKJ03_07525 [Methanoregulaceae archaeon]|nr:hypothetical protein [Methanoregulaceae archaeon]
MYQREVEHRESLSISGCTEHSDKHAGSRVRGVGWCRRCDVSDANEHCRLRVLDPS